MTTVTLQDIRDRARTINQSGLIEAVFVGALPALKIIAVAGMKEHFRSHSGPDGKKWPELSRPRVDGSNKPLEDTGRLKNSVQAKGVKELVLSSAAPQANRMQYGGRVVPTHAKMLAIPLTREAKRVGSPRQNGFPRPLFVYVSKNRNAFLAEKSAGDSIVLQYLLRRFVDIPARPFVGISPATWRKMERVLADRQAAYFTDLLSPTAVRRL